MISRQKLIEAVEKEYHRFIDDDRDVAHNRAIYDVLEIIKAQPPASQWIPCSSGKMPKNEQKAFITVQLTKEKRYATAATYFSETSTVYEDEWAGEGFYTYDSEYGWGRHENVIAWMPAEPYKGE